MREDYGLEEYRRFLEHDDVAIYNFAFQADSHDPDDLNIANLFEALEKEMDLLDHEYSENQDEENQVYFSLNLRFTPEYSIGKTESELETILARETQFYDLEVDGVMDTDCLGLQDLVYASEA